MANTHLHNWHVVGTKTTGPDDKGYMKVTRIYRCVSRQGKCNQPTKEVVVGKYKA